MKQPMITGTERERKERLESKFDDHVVYFRQLREDFIPDVSIKRRMNKNQDILKKVSIDAPTTVTKWKLNLTQL